MLSYPLHLTSPLMKGALVLDAQKKLASSKYGNFHPGELDGEYGEHSAAATHRAKYWLGYAQDEINQAYGSTLNAYLSGKKALPADNVRRRKARLARAADKPMREKAFQAAVSQIGQTEHPADSNISKFSTWYGVIGPWCAMFVTWCYVEAGSKQAFVKGSKYAYTPYLTRDARAGANALRLVSVDEVKRGDIVTFDWAGDGKTTSPYATDHVGLFDEWIVKGQSFKTVEGNTAVGNDSNGGEVMRRERTMPFVEAFIRCEA